MMKKVIISIVFLLLGIAGYTQSNVKIHGIFQSKDSTYMTLLKSNVFRWSEFNPDKSVKIPLMKNGFNLMFNIKLPQITGICPPGYSRSQNIYITPGDSLSFQVIPVGDNQYRLHFFGKNAAQYNYDAYMLQIFPFRLHPYFKKGDNPIQYKQQLLSWKERQMDSLMHYVKANPVSADFLRYAKAEISNGYVYWLYDPLDKKLVTKNELPSGYMKDAILDKNELSYNYKVALTYQNVCDYLENPELNFKRIANHIKRDFSGEDRSYLWSAMIGFYALKQQSQYRQELLQAIHDAPKYVKNKEYMDYIHRGEEYYTMINQPFPDSVLTHTFLRSFDNKEKITLKEMLDRYKGKILYLDFWGSWCFACRDDIAESHPAKQYVVGKNVVWIYIAVDKEEKAWQEAATQDSITANQYFLYDIYHSPLLEYLKVNAYPRYVIMDEKQNIGEPSAPRPNAYGFDSFKKDIDKYARKQIVVTF